MFKNYRKLYQQATLKCAELHLEMISRDLDYKILVRRYNSLVRQNNGGTSSQFSQSEIKDLIRLCHPDRHHNSELSNKVTQRLLAMKK